MPWPSCGSWVSDIVLPGQGLEILKEYDYVAIFDADFKPDTDFLVRFGDLCLQQSGHLSNKTVHIFRLYADTY